MNDDMLVGNAGSSLQPGATLDEHGCTFAVHAPQPRKLTLRLYDEAERLVSTHVFKRRQGDLQYCWIEGVCAGQLYALQLDSSSKTLLDPYARLFNRTLSFDDCMLQLDDHALTESETAVAKCVVLAPAAAGAGSNGRPARPTICPSQRVIYELHIKGFSQLNENVPEALRGRYTGLSHPGSLDYLRSLGVSTLQLMPCMSFMTEAHLQRRGLVNYWGYNPVSFMAPDWRYAIKDPVAEFRQMVDELHAAGFEVLLDVVYNHTAEADENGPILNFKLLDCDGYYHMQSATAFLNHSGCGNSFRADSEPGLRLVMDSLRYWHGSMGVDGFRFDLASTLGRVMDNGHHHFSEKSPFFTAVAQDPLLREAVMLAEPWDLGPDGYQLGRFPARWLEVNDRFRDGMRALWRGDPIDAGSAADLLMGTRSIFDKESRAAHCTVNAISYHDGFTLEDIVSYERRHNEANGEDNRDGHGNNLSSNHGFEGALDDSMSRTEEGQSILAARFTHKLGLMSSLLLARGTPHLLAGDERAHSQRGNNNAYCQDNPLSWLDWSQLSQTNMAWMGSVRAILEFRRKTGSLLNLNLADENWAGTTPIHEADWFDLGGAPMTVQHWEVHKTPGFALLTRLTHECVAVLLLNVGAEAVNATLPAGTADRELSLKLPQAHSPILEMTDKGWVLGIPARTLVVLMTN